MEALSLMTVFILYIDYYHKHWIASIILELKLLIGLSIICVDGMCKAKALM